MRMSKSKFLTMLMVAGSIISLTACGKKNQKPSETTGMFKQATPKKQLKMGGTVTYALENDSPFTGIFLSELADTSPDSEAASPGDEPLFGVSDNFKLNNKGAASLKFNQKHNTIEIRLRKKVRWSDGAYVTAKDMEYAYEILANPKVKTTQYTSSLENIKGMAAYHQGKAKTISGIEMPDGAKGKRMILHFKELRPAMLNAGNGFFWDHAVPYHYLKNVPFDKLISSDQVRKHPLYFGPFKMVHMVQGQSTSWSRNPYYWKGTPHFKHIEMSTVSTSNVTQAIKSHKFDIAGVLDNEYQEVKDTSNVNFLGEKTMLYRYIAFKVGKWDEKLGKNVQYAHPKMDNLALRKAMVYAMNIDQANQKLYHGLRYRVNSLIPTRFGKAHDKSIPLYTYNLTKANHLLDKANYKKDPHTGYRQQPNGKPLTINLAVNGNDSNNVSLWTNYIQQWKKIGLKVKFLGDRPMEFNNWVNAVKSSDPRIDVLANAWDPSGDPSPNVFYGERMPYNFARFVSPTNTRLLDEIDSKKAFNPDYRIKKLHEWQRWMYDNAYVVPTTSSYSILAISDKISGFSLKASSHNWFEAGFVKR